MVAHMSNQCMPKIALCGSLAATDYRFHEDHEEVEWSDGDERVIVVMIVVAVVSVLEVVLWW